MGFLEKTKQILLIILIGHLTATISTPNTKIATVLCNSGVFTAGDPFSISLNYILSELQSLTPSHPQKDFHNISPYPNAFAYGHAACTNNLTASDCTNCLRAANSAMFTTCVTRIGARAVLVDCTMRYEQYPFDD
ncbi:antifungal protein ginkbilobin-like protein [Impatiens glandulifera]|uniref:antifungal protein ginkbilobin-like protein n=1 Tax=Impatiens glandulifera TaxID=253017 RepID=UPI001FB19D21|nr:antifungal protein ginkbilobin-like protein [Impatiens glandulifera]